MSKWSNGNIGPCKKHIVTRRFLNINLDVEIQNEEVKKNGQNHLARLISRAGLDCRVGDNRGVCGDGRARHYAVATPLAQCERRADSTPGKY